MFRIFRFILPLAIIAVSVAGFLFLKNGSLSASAPAESSATDPQLPKETAWNSHVLTVKRQNIAPQILLHGRFETPRETALSAGINADVLEVNALDGATVVKGDLLVRLDDLDARLTLAQREADLAEINAQKRAETRAHSANQDALKREQRMLSLATRTQDRLATLAKSQVGSESVLDDARSRVQSSYLAVNSRQERIDNFDARLAQLQAREQRAVAGIDSARRDIERSIVRAPFNGRVTTVNVSPGERVRTGDPLITLYDVDFVELRVQVPERYLAQLRTNLQRQQSVWAQAELDGETLKLSLDRFAGKVARGRGGVDALFRLQSSAVTPDIGRTVSTTVELPTINNVCALPAVALYGNDVVYQLDDDSRLRAMTVARVGQYTDEAGQTQQLIDCESVADGTRIIISQIPSAVDGLLINPVDERSPSS